MIAFGPVPSRRLGRSLGINNIPPKVCTYSCVYCQVGRTKNMQTDRKLFFDPEDVRKEVGKKVKMAAAASEPIDYLTFVPDGEPTLDVNLGREILLLKPLGKKIAVITNSSLIWRADVREELSEADWVSLKLDSAEERTWRRINRPHRDLKWASIVEGMLEFSKTYKGRLMTETMLVEGINDSGECMKGVADLLARLRPARSYLSIPTRPPAEKGVRSPREETINRLFQILDAAIDHVEYLIGYEGDAFAFTGNVQEDLLSITAVHPMREEAVDSFLAKAKADWQVVDSLIAQGQLIQTEHEGRKFYMRKLS